MKTQVEPKKSRVTALAAMLLLPAVWLERARGRRRLGLACLYILVIGVCGFVLWWATSLNGLPDIGVPFDASHFERVSVPEDENAFVLYRQMADRLVALDPEFFTLHKTNQPWSQVAPEIREWVTANREALDLWMKGADRPRAFYIPPHEITISTPMEVLHKLREMIRIADLEASRLEESGDLTGAWGVYRAMLRSSRHAGMHGSAVQRLVGVVGVRTVAPRIIAWSENPRVGAPQLRAALADVIACEEMTPPASESLEIEFLSMMKALDEPQRWANDQLKEEQYWYRHMRGGLDAEFLLLREPERSRRVAQLVFANWLAYCDRHASQRPKTVTEFRLYEPEAAAPAQARVLLPEAIERWNKSTLLGRQFLPALGGYLGALDGERGVFAGLKVHLAEQLYKREHGKPSQKLGDLVGPYLERLPEGYEGIDAIEREPADGKARASEPRTK